MSAFNIDKGLDEIISSSGISAGGRKARAAASRGIKKSRAASSTKTLGKALAASKSAKAGAESTKGAGKAKARNAAPQAPALLANPLAQAKRAVVSNMPLDVNEEAVRQYFSANVGKVRKVEGSFRADGRPTGTYTLTFDKAGKAQTLLEKFHGQPVDGGKTHMSVQILLDAPPALPKTLQGRIGTPAAAPAAGAPESGKRRNRAKKSGDAPVKAAAAPAKQEGAKKAAKKTKAKAKPKPRTAADLDAEMSDYFAKADQNEISV